MPSPQPTIFLSYASEDRAAARLLRETLSAAGLDVWYDESELGGGDAWDQKIRRQIRDCDYFMPVISAMTERRKEGYFRREWRLATERTLDMADDVMFLVPVCIDDLDQTNARVPEKFFSVQWLRVPGGVSTPALDTLARRLAAGDHIVPPLIERPVPAKRSTHGGGGTPPPMPSTAKDHHDGPPPMPPFPHMAEKSGFAGGLKFLAEVVWWIITSAWLLLRRMPRWVRVVLAIWFVFWLMTQCSVNRGNGSSRQPAAATKTSEEKKAESAAKKAEVSQAVQNTVDKLTKLGTAAGKQATDSGWTKMGTELAQGVISELKGINTYGKDILVVPFNASTANVAEGDGQALADILAALYGRLAVIRPDTAAINTTPMSAFDDDAFVKLGRQLAARYVLGAQVTGEGTARSLSARIIKVDDGSIAWRESYSLSEKSATDIGNEIANAALSTVPAK